LVSETQNFVSASCHFISIKTFIFQYFSWDKKSFNSNKSSFLAFGGIFTTNLFESSEKQRHSLLSSSNPNSLFSEVLISTLSSSSLSSIVSSFKSVSSASGNVTVLLSFSSINCFS
jgi:hypothetical protein